MLLPAALTSRFLDVTPERVDFEYPEHFLTEWRVSPDKDGLLFSPVTFRGDRVLQDAVETVTALVLDYDDGTPPEVAVEPWEDFDFVISSTHSNMREIVKEKRGKRTVSPALPKFRMVFPLQEPLAPDAFRRLWAWAASRSKGKLDVSCKDLFRRYYWLSRHPEATDYYALHNAGRMLSYADVGAEERPAPARRSAVTKADVLALLKAHPSGDAPGSGMFAGMGKARARGPRQAEDPERIEAECSFMAHARDEAAELPEPEWYAALSVWVRCEDGDTLAHARSEPYAGYDEDETAEKIERAKEHGPVTCARASEFHEGCKTCPHFGRITSPVQLGSPDPQEDPEAAAERAAEDLDEARDRLARAKAAVENARVAYKERQKSAKYIVNPDERVKECEPERQALEAALEERDRAAAYCKSQERKARELEATANPPEDVDPDVWQALKLNPASGAPIPCYSNVYKIVRLDPLLGPELRTNILGEVPEWGGKAITDNDLSMTCEYLSDTYGVEARLLDVKAAISAVAGKTFYNPVVEWLNGLPPWDGVSRAETLLTEVLHASDTATGLYATYLRKFLIAAVRRAQAPGTKVDTMLVLQAKQGIKKTTFFQGLFSEPFTHNTKFDVANKDSFGQISHGWAYEWGELSQMSNRTIEDIKNFISSQKDTYRSPYAHYACVHYRHTVFVGTTNNPEPLNDPTGARRFWIIPITKKVDLTLLEAIRDQVWAEALARAEAGEDHWLTDEEESHQEADSLKFQEEDPRKNTIARWLAKRKEPFETGDVCIILGIAPDRAAARMVGAHLRALGCVSRSTEGGSVRRWYPPEPAEPVDAGNVVIGNFGGSTNEKKLFGGSS